MLLIDRMIVPMGLWAGTIAHMEPYVYANTEIFKECYGTFYLMCRYVFSFRLNGLIKVKGVQIRKLF